MSFPTDRPPRVLMFAPAFAPSFFSEALVNSKLALAMLYAGWQPTVFAIRGSGESYAQDWEEPWTRLRDIRCETSPRPRTLLRVCARVLGAIRARHPVSGALWAESVARHALNLHRDLPFDLVLSRSTSCVAHLPALIFRSGIRNATKPPWIANWNDPPGHQFPPPYNFHLPPVQRILKDRYLRAAAAGADINSFPSKLLQDYLTEPLRLEVAGVAAPSRSMVVPHIGLGWRPRAVPRVNPKRFRISHAGNLSRERDPTLFLAALAKLAARNPDVRVEFEIIGSFDKALEARFAELNLERLVLRRNGLPYLACLEQLAKADAQLLIEAPCERGIFLPSKLTDYVEVGRPILALSPRFGVVRDLLEQHNFGYVASNNSEAETEAALEQLFTEWRANSHITEANQSLEKLRALVHPNQILGQIRSAAEQVGTGVNSFCHQKDYGHLKRAKRTVLR